MKTAISIPETQFRAAERLALRLGLNRSELYRTALAEFLVKDCASSVTEKLDQIYGSEELRTGLHKGLQVMQARAIQRHEEWS